MLRIRKGFKVLVSAVIVTVGLSGTAQAAVKLAKTSLSLSAGSGYMLALKGNKYPTVWKSSKPTVVKVMFSDCTKVLLKARKTGTAKVTAKVNGKTYICKVTVKKKQAMPKKLKLIAGDSFKLSVKKTASWKSGKTSVVKLSAKKSKNNKITAKKAGTATVTAKIGKKNYTCKVTVLPKKWKKAAEKKLPGSTSDKTGQKATGTDKASQNETGTDKTGQNETGTDKTGQNEIGTDRTGQNETGTDKTGQSETGTDKTGQNESDPDKTDQKTEEGIPITSVSLNKKELTMDTGTTEKLKVTFLPAGSEKGKTVEWYAFPDDVAEVSQDGTVKGIGEGTAWISLFVDDKLWGRCDVTVRDLEKPGTISGFDGYGQDCKTTSAGTMASDGSVLFRSVFLSNGNERWLDGHVTFEIKDVTPEAIQKVFRDLNISSAVPSLTVSSGAEEVEFDNYYGFYISEPVGTSQPESGPESPVGGKSLQIKAGPATRVVKLWAKLDGKIVDTIYLAVRPEDKNQNYNTYDLALYKKVRQKVEARLWTPGMSALEKLEAISGYINKTCHYPNTASTDKNINPTYWKRFSVDNLFRFYELNDPVMNRILDLQGGEITCQASSIIERVATEDLGLRYLYDSETDTVADGEGVYVGMGSHSTNPSSPWHETLWYIAPDGARTPIDTQGMYYDEDSAYATCEAHQCLEKLVSLR